MATISGMMDVQVCTVVLAVQEGIEPEDIVSVYMTVSLIIKRC